MTTKLVLVRHGQTEWNVAGRYQGQSDVRLSAEGIEQAKSLAEHFPEDNIKAIYSSSLSRAAETARSIAAVYHLPVCLEDDLQELDFGSWEGMTYAQISKLWPQEIAAFFSRPDMLDIPQGESFSALQERAINKIKEIILNHENDTVVIVAHGAILRTILAFALHMPLRYLWSLRQFNTAVNILSFNQGNFIVELLNSTAHLHSSTKAIKVV